MMPGAERELRDKTETGGERDGDPAWFNDNGETHNRDYYIITRKRVSRCRHNHVGAALCSCDSDRAHLCREHSLTAADIMAG